ncbi:shikimate kinase [Tenacibaculum sp. MAR_2009_124]|uniref:shikimate kinase n=1 Tax=Tenacibaculum sp. MAR_2009_124 TaxID=1250059 RepID=UPI0008942A13|nr:shikimate kinase [Tenacibaculum sp. MAR_2009_124]SEB47686.1 shikimate kinase [Tenacibaculum sp. MAR_2009_124]
MKVILLGYMASGKSFIGKILAKNMQLPFIDLDNYIEEKENLTIPQIFNSKGEIYFRTIENKYLKELLTNSDDYVLSLGGGTPCYANNMEIIDKADNTISFYLKASISTIVNRLRDEKDKRPLVASLKNEDLLEFVAKHLFERNTFYSSASNTVHIDNKEGEVIVDEINSLL